MAIDGNDFSCSPEDGYVISGTVDERNTLTGRARVNGTQISTFTANFNDLYNDNSSLTKITDIWSDSDGTYTETYTIDADGDITGNDTDGCVFTGSFGIIETNYNMYDLELTVSNCGDTNGTYTGKAILDRTTEDEDTLTSYLSNGEYAIAGDIYRQ
ncbi:hypothetical protein ACFOEK_12080 [Litoribrevibacter euphylliae]|uniref:Uncharacterized protein n=1 Tax=Litoribrevibacter euphylliae TaxID=1834034 RepID=A0ABV7HGL7_9GAMM